MRAALAQRTPVDATQPLTSRDSAARGRYLHAALSQIPRLLGAIDRHPYRATYGCLDRQFWHYRTSPFPSEMYQEGVLPLALVATTRLPGNRWYGQPRVRELAVAALRFAARSSHGDGSCDDYYPFERALGAAAFSFAAATEAYRLLELNDAELVAWLRRRAAWLMRHDESGQLANHQALVGLGLARLAALTGAAQYGQAAADRVERVLSWQSTEGWFDEYGGADPGYQTVTIDCLAKCRRLTHTSPTRQRGGSADSRRLAFDFAPASSLGGDSPSLARRASVLSNATATRLDDSLRNAVSFARLFLHPDDSYAGPYGSRGTCHFYPHGMELLAGENAEAADLADGFLRALDTGRHAYFDDDRMYAHRLGNLIEAYLDWSPERPEPRSDAEEFVQESTTYLPQAGLLVRRTASEHTIISAARGGVFKHFVEGRESITDAGLVVEFADGRVAVSQRHQSAPTASGRTASGRRQPADRTPRDVDFQPSGHTVSLTVSRPLHFVRHETATPITQALFHIGMCTVGRTCRTAIRKLLQRRLITGRHDAPVRLTRRFELGGNASLRVIDTIELTSPTANVQRMSYGTDHESAYVAASGVYQESVLEPWTDLSGHVAELNERRRVTILREWSSESSGTL